MWEKAQEIQYLPILPQAGEMKAALTPPLTPKEKQRPNYILRVQVLLCLLAAAAVLAMSRVAPEAYRQCGNAFRAAMDSGVELNGQEQLLKFTSETVSSLQAGAPVRAANAYIGRFWLGARFYFVSTGYCLTPLCILHLPGQAKARQLVLLYRYYARRGHFPPDATVWRWCGLPAARPSNEQFLRRLAGKILDF